MSSERIINNIEVILRQVAKWSDMEAHKSSRLNEKRYAVLAEIEQDLLFLKCKVLSIKDIVEWSEEEKERWYEYPMFSACYYGNCHSGCTCPTFGSSGVTPPWEEK